jgi:hypothetical protein
VLVARGIGLKIDPLGAVRQCACFTRHTFPPLFYA